MKKRSSNINVSGYKCFLINLKKQKNKKNQNKKTKQNKTKQKQKQNKQAKSFQQTLNQVKGDQPVQ